MTASELFSFFSLNVTVVYFWKPFTGRLSFVKNFYQFQIITLNMSILLKTNFVVLIFPKFVNLINLAKINTKEIFCSGLICKIWHLQRNFFELICENSEEISHLNSCLLPFLQILLLDILQ